MKKRFFVVLIACLAIMSIALVGCSSGDKASSGNGGSSGSSASSGAASVDLNDLNSILAKYGVTEPESVSSKGVDLSSDKPKTKEELGTVYENLKKMPVGKTTVKEVMDLMGSDPNMFSYWADSGTYTLRWYASDSKSSYVAANFKKKDDGSWDFRGSSKTNI